MPRRIDVDIYNYTDFRAFLRDFYEYRRKHAKAFSLRYFAQKAGFASHNVLRQVMYGDRNVARKSIDKFIRGMGLESKRADYFRLMVLFAQAKDPAEKKRLMQEMLALRKRASRRDYVLKLHHDLYDEWYHVAVREMLGLADFHEDHKEMGQRLHPPITPAQVRGSLQLLERLGLVRRDRQGVPKQSRASIRPQKEIRPILARKHLRDMGELGMNALDWVSPEQREISTMTLGMSRKALVEIKERIQRFKEELVRYLEQDTESKELIYQMNLQLFPLMEQIQEEPPAEDSDSSQADA